MDFSIGTAQFGLSYGVTNTKGKVSAIEINKILEHARRNNIIKIDTAIDYGESEKSLGQANISNCKVVTKLPKVPNEAKDISQWINDQINSSLSRLKIPSLYGLLLHNPADLLSEKGEEIWESINLKKNEGLIKKIGFSIYDPIELDSLWEIFKPDIVQAPFNILDRRIKNSGWLKKLNENNVEIQVRSIFLQGLLLMSPIERNNIFYKWHSIWNILDTWLLTNNISPIEASLGFVLSEKYIDCIVVGVESYDQLNEIISTSNNQFNFELPAVLNVDDLDLIEPYNWGIK